MSYFHDRSHDRFHRFDEEEVFICKDVDDRRRRHIREEDEEEKRGCRCRRDEEEERRRRRRDEEEEERRRRRRDEEDKERRKHRRDDEDRECRKCGREEFTFCATGRGILFGVAIGDRVLIRVKNNTAELSLVFQGMIGKIALFTNGNAGTGLLRIPLKDIITVRIV